MRKCRAGLLLGGEQGHRERCEARRTYAVALTGGGTRHSPNA